MPATYPKMLYNTGGRSRQVIDAPDEALWLAAGWSLAPTGPSPIVRRVAASTTSVPVVPDNFTRRATLKIINDSPSNSKILYGIGCSETNFTWIIRAGGQWEMPLRSGLPEYYGIITAVWLSAEGSMQSTETEA